MSEDQEKPVTAEEYRKKWKPELVKTPGMKGSNFLMRKIDPAEYLLLYVDKEEVAKKDATWGDITKAAAKKIGKLQEKANKKLLQTVVLQPKIVDGPAKGPNELNFEELREFDKRFLIDWSLKQAGILGEAAQRRKFLGEKQTEKPRESGGGKIPSKTK